jgi:hypothetical protein
MSNPFDFLLDVSKMRSSGFDMMTARECANNVANAYINEGLEPNDYLCKMAAERSFTPEQVKIVATEANKAIHSYRYKEASDKYSAADFPLADAKLILSKLQAHDESQVKVAAHFTAPKISQGATLVQSDYDFFGIIPEEMDKTASVKQKLSAGLEKTALLRDKVQDRLVDLQNQFNAAEESFIKEAKEMILVNGVNEAERYRTLGSIFHFTKQAGKLDCAKNSLAKLAHVLKAQEILSPELADEAFNFFVKEADQQAPTHMISKHLDGVEIVNGNHPLYITLDTISHCKQESEHEQNRYKMIMDTLGNIKQKIRAL